MQIKHSVPIPLVRSALAGCVRQQVDIDSLLEGAGLGHLVANLSASQSAQRVSFDDFGALLRAMWFQLDDESCGFFARPLKVGTFGLMCHSVISAGNFRRVLLRSARFMSLVADDLSIELVESGNEARLVVRIDNPQNLDQSFIITSIFVIWIRLCCWLIDKPILLQRINFSFAQPSYVDEFSNMFPCRQEFAQSENSVVFSRHLLSLPVKQTPESLRAFLQHAPESLLTQFRQDNSITAQVKRLLLHHHGMQSEWLEMNFESVANLLCKTTHTVRRRLKEEGTSYQEIKDSLRRDHAQRLLQQQNNSIGQIAQQLGFSESAAFARAFKKWTGSSPGAFREQSN